MAYFDPYGGSRNIRVDKYTGQVTKTPGYANPAPPMAPAIYQPGNEHWDRSPEANMVYNVGGKAWTQNTYNDYLRAQAAEATVKADSARRAAEAQARERQAAYDKQNQAAQAAQAQYKAESLRQANAQRAALAAQQQQQAQVQQAQLAQYQAQVDAQNQQYATLQASYNTPAATTATTPLFDQAALDAQNAATAAAATQKAAQDKAEADAAAAAKAQAEAAAAAKAKQEAYDRQKASDSLTFAGQRAYDDPNYQPSATNGYQYQPTPVEDYNAAKGRKKGLAGQPTNYDYSRAST